MQFLPVLIVFFFGLSAASALRCFACDDSKDPHHLPNCNNQKSFKCPRGLQDYCVTAWTNKKLTKTCFSKRFINAGIVPNGCSYRDGVMKICTCSTDNCNKEVPKQ